MRKNFCRRGKSGSSGSVKKIKYKVFSVIKKGLVFQIHPFFIVLFLWLVPHLSQASFEVTNELTRSYQEILKLKSTTAYQLLEESRAKDPSNSLYHLVENYRDILHILTEENKDLYSSLRSKENDRINKIREDKTNSPWKKLAEAEIRFQWALAKIKFGDELAAAWGFRQVYDLLKENQTKYPAFIHQKKLLGLYQIFIGSVPDKYEWLKNTLGFRGKVSTGISLLKEVERSESFFSLEAHMLRVAAEKYILKEGKDLSGELEKHYKYRKDNLLYTFLIASVEVKEGLSDKAFENLDKFDYTQGYLKFPLAYLIKGEILLYRENYLQAREYFEKYIKNTRGQDRLKDATYKIFLTYWLSGDETTAAIWMDKINETGQAVYDADKYAEKFAREKQFPDKILMKSRLSTDGGYFDKALQQLSRYCIKPGNDNKDNIEFWYRKGRIYQLKGMPREAIGNFRKSIALSEGKNYYFAPNACLQLGYIFQDEKDFSTARSYFEKALSYKDHEYKNSIDSKARAALSELPDK